MPVASYDIHHHLTDGLDFTKANQTWSIDRLVSVTSDKGYGVYSTKFGSTLLNNGDVAGFGSIGALFTRDGASVVNASGASISGTTGVELDGQSSLVSNQGAINGFRDAGVRLEAYQTALNNSGDITGVTSGVHIGGDFSVVVNDGHITGSSDGVRMDGLSGALTNTGTIAGFHGVHVGVGDLSAVITNTGVISGTNAAIFSSGGDVTLNNSGTIAGEINLWTGWDTVINTGKITGDVFLGAGNDVYDGRGGSVTSFWVYGQNGRDNLIGGEQSDWIDGGAQADFISGRGGVDVIIGGDGADKLLGGAGADRFVYESIFDSTPAAGRDVIQDFSHADHDLIDLSFIDAILLFPSPVTPDPNDAFHFVGTAAFSHTPGELRYGVTSVGATVEGDVNGDGVADIAILLQHVTSLTADDFVL